MFDEPLWTVPMYLPVTEPDRWRSLCALLGRGRHGSTWPSALPCAPRDLRRCGGWHYVDARPTGANRRGQDGRGQYVAGRRGRGIQAVAGGPELYARRG